MCVIFQDELVLEEKYFNARIKKDTFELQQQNLMDKKSKVSALIFVFCSQLKQIVAQLLILLCTSVHIMHVCFYIVIVSCVFAQTAQANGSVSA